MTRRYILDAWAVLALLQGEEPAASRVKELFDEANEKKVELRISLINFGEVMYRIGKSRGENAAWQTLNEIRRLALAVDDVDEETVWSAVRYKIGHPISYSNAFAAAMAEKRKAVLVTGDPELFNLSEQIKIEKLERKR